VDVEDVDKTKKKNKQKDNKDRVWQRRKTTMLMGGEITRKVLYRATNHVCRNQYHFLFIFRRNAKSNTNRVSFST
jgi:hypothetical protein